MASSIGQPAFANPTAAPGLVFPKRQEFGTSSGVSGATTESYARYDATPTHHFRYQPGSKMRVKLARGTISGPAGTWGNQHLTKFNLRKQVGGAAGYLSQHPMTRLTKTQMVAANMGRASQIPQLPRGGNLMRVVDTGGEVDYIGEASAPLRGNQALTQRRMLPGLDPGNDDAPPPYEDNRGDPLLYDKGKGGEAPTGSGVKENGVKIGNQAEETYITDPVKQTIEKSLQPPVQYPITREVMGAPRRYVFGGATQRIANTIFPQLQQQQIGRVGSRLPQYPTISDGVVPGMATLFNPATLPSVDDVMRGTIGSEVIMSVPVVQQVRTIDSGRVGTQQQLTLPAPQPVGQIAGSTGQPIGHISPGQVVSISVTTPDGSKQVSVIQAPELKPQKIEGGTKEVITIKEANETTVLDNYIDTIMRDNLKRKASIEDQGSSSSSKSRRKQVQNVDERKKRLERFAAHDRTQQLKNSTKLSSEIEEEKLWAELQEANFISSQVIPPPEQMASLVEDTPKVEVVKAILKQVNDESQKELSENTMQKIRDNVVRATELSTGNRAPKLASDPVVSRLASFAAVKRERSASSNAKREAYAKRIKEFEESKSERERKLRGKQKADAEAETAAREKQKQERREKAREELRENYRQAQREKVRGKQRAESSSLPPTAAPPPPPRQSQARLDEPGPSSSKRTREYEYEQSDAQLVSDTFNALKFTVEFGMLFAATKWKDLNLYGKKLLNVITDGLKKGYTQAEAVRRADREYNQALQEQARQFGITNYKGRKGEVVAARIGGSAYYLRSGSGSRGPRDRTVFDDQGFADPDKEAKTENLLRKKVSGNVKKPKKKKK